MTQVDLLSFVGLRIGCMTPLNQCTIFMHTPSFKAHYRHYSHYPPPLTNAAHYRHYSHYPPPLTNAAHFPMLNIQPNPRHLVIPPKNRQQQLQNEFTVTVVKLSIGRPHLTIATLPPRRYTDRPTLTPKLVALTISTVFCIMGQETGCRHA